MEAMSFMVRLAADCTRLVFFAHAHIDIAVSSEFFELHLERRISRRSASPLVQAPHGCLLARLTSPGSPFHAPRGKYPWVRLSGVFELNIMSIRPPLLIRRADI